MVGMPDRSLHALAHRQVRQLGWLSMADVRLAFSSASIRWSRRPPLQLLAGTVLQHGIKDLVGRVELQLKKIFV